MANRIDYTIGFKVDTTPLTTLQSSLQNVKTAASSALQMDTSKVQGANAEFRNVIQTVNEVDGALKKAFNSDLGTLNVSKFQQQLKQSGLTLTDVKNKFHSVGTEGQAAFRDLTTQILTANMQVKQTNGFLQGLGKTFVNTLKWGFASSVINGFTNGVKQAYNYVEKLDGSLNDIRIVTGKSSDEMKEFAKWANKAAVELGSTTKAMAEAALIYYQQGDTDDVAKRKGKITTKVANVTGMETEEASELTTAVWNGFNVGVNEAELYMDKLAAIGAATASSFEEVAVGISKVSSAAHVLGVDIDQLGAQIATIVSVTREAPETIGTSLKTIYARMSDIEAGTDGETTLGSYTAEMKSLGINVLDANGNLRDMGNVIEEIGGKWETYTRNQQIALAQTMGGTRQFSRLISLFDNWDKYTDTLKVAADAQGTLNNQQDIYMEKLSVKMEQLTNAGNRFKEALFDVEDTGGLLDTVTWLLDAIAKGVKAIGGGGTLLLAIFTTLGRIFAKDIAVGLTKMVYNMQVAKDNAAQVRAIYEVTGELGRDKESLTPAEREIVELKEKIYQYEKSITQEQMDQANLMIQQVQAAQKQKENLEKRKNLIVDIYAKSKGSEGNKPQTKETAKKVLDTGESQEGLSQEDMARSIRTFAARFKAEIKGLSMTTEEAMAAGLESALAKAGDTAAQEIQEVRNNLDNTKAQRDVAQEEYDTATQNYNDKKQKYDEMVAKGWPDKSGGRGLAASRALAEMKAAEEAMNSAKTKVEELNGEVDKLQGELVEAQHAMENIDDSMMKGVTPASQMAEGLRSKLEHMFSTGMIDESTFVKAEHAIKSFEQEAKGATQGSAQLNAQFEDLTNTLRDLAGGAFEQVEQASNDVRTGFVNLGNSAEEMGNKGKEGIDKINKAAKSTQGIQNFISGISSLSQGVMSFGMIANTIKTAIENFKDDSVTAGESWKQLVSGILMSAPMIISSFVAINASMGWIGLLVAAIAGIGVVVATFIKTAEEKAREAGQAAKEAISSYEDQKQKVDNLTSSLDDLNTKIQELYAKGPLTLTEEEELNKLEAEKRALEQQLEIEKQINEERNKRAAAKVAEAIEEGTYNVKSSFEFTNGRVQELWLDKEGGFNGFGNVEVDLSDKEKVDEEYSKILSAISVEQKQLDETEKKLKDVKEKIAKETDKDKKKDLEKEKKELEKEKKEIEQHTEELLNHKKLLDESVEEYKDYLYNEYDYDGLVNAMKQLKLDPEANKESIEKLEKIFEQYYNATNNFESIAAKAFEDATDKDKGRIEEIEKILTDNMDYLTKKNFSDAALKKLGLTTEEITRLRKSADAANVSLQGLFNTFLSMKTPEEYIDYMVNNVEAMVYQEQKDVHGKKAKEYSKTAKEGVSGILAQTKAGEFGDYSMQEVQQAMAAIDPTKFDWSKGAESQALYTQAIRDQIDATRKLAEANEYDRLRREGMEYAELTADAYDVLVSNTRAATLAQLKRQGVTDKETLAQMTSNKAIAERINRDLKFHRGLEKVNKALAKNVDLLGDSLDSIEALGEVKTGLEEIFDVEIDPQIIKDNINLVKRIAAGENGAMDEFGQILGKDYLDDIMADVPDKIKKNFEFDDVNKEVEINMNELSKKVQNTLLELANDPNWISHPSIESGEFLTDLNTMIEASNMTMDQVKKYLDLNNFSGEVEMTTVTANKKLWFAKPIDNDKDGIPEEYEAASVDYQDSYELPNVKSVTKLPPRGGTVSGLGKKGGSGSGGGSKKKVEKNENKRDIYKTIDSHILQTENELSKLEREREKLSGGKIIQNLQKQLENLEKQKFLQEEKLKIAKEEEELLRKEIQEIGKDGFTFDIKFDESGSIINYDEIAEQELAALDAATRKFNSSSQSDADQEAYDKAKERYSKFEDLIEEYYNLHDNTINDIEESIANAESQIIEKNIETLTLDVQLKIDINDFKKTWRELQKSILFGDDDIFASFKNAEEGLKDILVGEGDGVLTTQIERTKLFLEEYEKIMNGETSSIFIDASEKALEAAKEMHEGAMSSAQTALEYINTLKDSVKSSFEDIVSLHDSILDSFDRTLGIIEHQIAVKELLFGDNANIKEETEEKFNVQLQKIEAAKQKIEDSEKRALDILGERAVSELNAEELYNWTEQQVAVSEAYQNIFSSVEEALQTINSLLEQDIQNNLTIIENQLTNNAGWDYLSERWEKDQEIADVYLSGVNQEYELQKLLNKINQDLLDKQYDTLSAQKKINAFKNDELEILMKKDKLTQAELDRANKLYELTLLQIALDEARNNKSSMKLKRDSQGNYTYQYVANEEEIAKKEQEIADKQNEIYKQNVENATESISNFNSLGKEMQEELNGLFDDARFQEYLGLLSSGESESERAKELEAWIQQSMSDIGSDYNYLMGAAQSNALASLQYIFKDLGIENVDFNNLSDEQRQILLDEGINLQRLESLLGFDTNNLSQILDGLNSSVQTVIDEYINRVSAVTNASSGVEAPEEYYDTLDLIKMNTENLRDIFREQKDKVWQEYSDINGSLKGDIALLEEELKELVKDGGLLQTNNESIVEKLGENAKSITEEIKDEIVKVKTAVEGVSAAIAGLDFTNYGASSGGGNDGSNDSSGGDNGGNNNGYVPIVNNTGGSTNTKAWSSYEEAAAAGYSNIKTKDEFSRRGGSDKEQFGTYERYLEVMYNKYVNGIEPQTFNKNDRISYNGKDTYNVESVDEGKLKINDYLSSTDSSFWIDASLAKPTNYRWKDLKNTDIGKANASWGPDKSEKYALIAASSSGKAIYEYKEGPNKGERAWCDPINGKAAEWTSKKVSGALKKKYPLIAKFDTGGYTGEWLNGSKDGRLAWLHQKELVLNETDTPKILDAVRLVREISAGSIIKDFEIQMRNTLSSLENQLIGTYANIEGMAAAAKQSTDQMLEQAVHIEASFPGVKDAREIEAALNNLVNVASQYATEDK